LACGLTRTSNVFSLSLRSLLQFLGMDINTLISYLAAIASVAMAIWILYRDPRSFVHWVFAGGMVALAAEAGLTGMMFYDISYTEVTPWQRYLMIPHALVPGIWLIFSLSFGRANYREFLSRWKWTIIAVFGLPLGLLIGFPEEIFLRSPIYDEHSRVFLPVGWSGYALYLFCLIGAVLVLMNLERTLRYSVGHTRWQVKFLFLGLASIFGARIYTGSQILLFSLLEAEMQTVNMGALLIANLLMARSLARTRLFKFDFYLSHTVLYNSVTVLLVGIYFISVGVVAKVVFYFRRTQDPAVLTFLVFAAILGLAVFLLSDRLRLQRKRLISRHFKRPQYDYPRVWSSFTARTASLTGINDLCRNIVRMVSETLEVLSASIWLWDEQEEVLSLGSSTALAPAKGENPKISGKEAKEVIESLGDQAQPVDLRDSAEGWLENLKHTLSELLKEGRADLCVPLRAAGQVVGILTVGARVATETYSFEDRELLKTVADQAAANLLTLRLEERLQQAREMEAFQVMSAFFMHDLKNLASRLSLVTQNLPVHFANPEFRADALKTISQSLDKINGMCNRLSLLSQKLELRLQDTDLNETVRTVLRGLDGLLKARPAADLQPLPKLKLDAEQFYKVLTNLFLNANEAIEKGGNIRVSTAARGNWAVLSIADDGCGMSRDFMDRHLFRPFQTTKRQGMGIGLFHCKKIIEAHQGRIEAESGEGRGTTFRVLIPLKNRV
jgi:putative PEP-CTERM system histidine kinase